LLASIHIRKSPGEVYLMQSGDKRWLMRCVAFKVMVL